MVRVRSPQDLGAAALFVLIGAAGLWFGKDLTFGSTSRMGPGYFPMILSALILLLGIALAARSMVLAGPPIDAIHIRPIVMILGAILLFGALVQYIGLFFTAILITFVAAYARREVGKLETLALGIGLAAFSVAVFVYALRQPLPAFWGAP